MNRFSLLLTPAFLALTSGFALAQANVQGLTQTYVVRGGSSIDYSAAQPKVLPRAPLPAAIQPTTAPVYPGAPSFSPGAVGTGVTNHVRLAPSKSNLAPPQGSDAAPSDYGSAQLPFDTFRVNGFGATDTTNSPYRAAGILFFSEPDGQYYCSASLIKKGIVVTAAHCVAAFGKGQFYSNWQFIPAYDDGDAPYGAWSAKSATVLTSYVNGTDPCSQAGVVCQDDVAVLTLNPNGSGLLPGSVTGYFAYGINGYGYANGRSTVLVSQIGYPANLDFGDRMQRNDAQGTVIASQANNTVIGSLMSGGSSGGPWVVNWGAAPKNTGTFGFAPTRDVIVGVTSWGTVNLAYKEQGAAPFTSNNISVLVNAVCAASPGNC